MTYEIKSFSSDLQFALHTAKEAGDAILPLFQRKDIKREIKPDRSDVSEADYLSNKIVIDAITEYDPNTALLTEETKDEFSAKYGSVPPSCWIVDPLDATTIFLSGNNAFLVLIAKLENHLPQISVAYEPISGATYFAERGKGAYKISADGFIDKLWRDVINPNQALRQKTVDFYDDPIVASLGQHFSAASGFDKPVVLTSSYDLPHFKLGIAAGSYDFNIFYLNDQYRSQNTGSGLWDNAPIDLILEEANCKIVNDKGQNFAYHDPKHVCQMVISLAPGLNSELASNIIREQLKINNLPTPRN